jgi:hypothetical protein
MKYKYELRIDIIKIKFKMKELPFIEEIYDFETA